MLQLCYKVNDAPLILKYSEDKKMIAYCLTNKALWSVLN